MTPDELKTTGVVLTAIVAIGTALALISRHAYRAWLAVAAFASDFGRMPARVSGLTDANKEMCRRVGAIEGELKPNGGSSLRDAVSRVEQITIGTRAHVRLSYQISRTPTFEIDVGGRVTWVNRAYVEQYGLSLEDISGNKWLSQIHPDDRDRVVREWAHIVEDQRQGDVKYQASFRGAAYQEIDVVVYPIFGHAGECLGWVGYSRSQA